MKKGEEHSKHSKRMALVGLLSLAAFVTIMGLIVFSPSALTENSKQDGSDSGNSEQTDGANSSDPWSWEPTYIPEGGDEDQTPRMSDTFLPPEDPTLWPAPEPNVRDLDDGAQMELGRITVIFQKSAGVERMREIVKEHGGTWLGGNYYESDSVSDVIVEVMVPEGQEEKIKDELEKLPEVNASRLNVLVPALP